MPGKFFPLKIHYQAEDDYTYFLKQLEWDIQNLHINLTNSKYSNDLNKLIELSNQHHNPVLEGFHYPKNFFLDVCS